MTHAYGVAIACIVALLWTPVFPLDLYSGTHPIFGGGRRLIDGDEYGLFPWVFGSARERVKERKRMELINEAFDSKLTQEHGGMAPVTSLKPYGSRVVAYKNNK